VFKDLIAEKLPRIMTHFQNLEFEISHVASQWFLCLFVGYLPTETVLRVLDMFLLEGVKVLFKVGLALLKLNETAIMNCMCFEDCYELLKTIPPRCFNSDSLMKCAFKEMAYSLIPISTAKIKQMRTSHFKLIEQKNKTSVYNEIFKSTDYSQKELECLSMQFKSMVKMNPDNQNLLMDFETFHSVIIGLLRPSSSPSSSSVIMNDRAIKLIFNALDQNSDGSIEFREFTIGLYVLRRGSHQQKLQLLFNAFDRDKLGFVDRDQLNRSLTEMLTVVKVHIPNLDQTLQTMIPSTQGKVDFKTFNDGVMSIPELKSWLLELCTIYE